jgi:hypothetical protein
VVALQQVQLAQIEIQAGRLGRVGVLHLGQAGNGLLSHLGGLLKSTLAPQSLTDPQVAVRQQVQLAVTVWTYMLYYRFQVCPRETVSRTTDLHQVPVFLDVEWLSLQLG